MCIATYMHTATHADTHAYVLLEVLSFSILHIPKNMSVCTDYAGASLSPSLPSLHLHLYIFSDTRYKTHVATLKLVVLVGQIALLFIIPPSALTSTTIPALVHLLSVQCCTSFPSIHRWLAALPQARCFTTN